MPKATKECRVCGKTYTACNTNRHFDGSFHWREVACSPECGQVYLQRVAASRKKSTSDALENPVIPEVEPVVTTQVSQEEKPKMVLWDFEEEDDD